MEDKRKLTSESEPPLKTSSIDCLLQTNYVKNSTFLHNESYTKSEPLLPLNSNEAAREVNANEDTERDNIEGHIKSFFNQCEQPTFSVLESSLSEFNVLDETNGSDFSSDCDVPNDELKAKETAVEFASKLKERSLLGSNVNCVYNELADDRQFEKSTDTECLCVNTNKQGYTIKENCTSDCNKTSEEQSQLKYRENKDNDCRTKTVLEEIESNHFDFLPEGWIKVTHNSGMPIYLHKPSRVCTMSRPYHLGPGSAKKHSVPLSAIPCFSYKKALENISSMCAKKSPSSTGLILPNVQMETAAENQASQSLDPIQLRDYCSSLFNFKIVNRQNFKSRVAHHKQLKQKKQEERQERLTLPEGTKLLKFPIADSVNPSSSQPQKEWIMNLTGKSYVCILHEYARLALKNQPSYEFKVLENPSSPYSATVTINGTHYGTASGASKKLAKLEAAKVTLEILIPEIKNKIETEMNNSDSNSYEPSIFDEIKVQDPRVAEICAKTTEPSPYVILLTCLQRNNSCIDDVKIHYSTNKSEQKKNVFTMNIGSHSATVLCNNKREGKQLASQAILQALHPHLTKWGSILRLYGNSSINNLKEKKKEEQEITSLQSKASSNQPNTAILEKLRSEMRKLRDKKLAAKPIDKFVPSDKTVFTSLSSSDLNKISL